MASTPVMRRVPEDGALQQLESAIYDVDDNIRSMQYRRQDLEYALWENKWQLDRVYALREEVRQVTHDLRAAEWERLALIRKLQTGRDFQSRYATEQQPVRVPRATRGVPNWWNR